MNLNVSKDTPKLRREFRVKRDALLAATDPWVLPDRGLTEDETNSLYTYRQALRDAANELADATTWTLPLAPLFLRSTPPFNG